MSKIAAPSSSSSSPVNTTRPEQLAASLQHALPPSAPSKIRTLLNVATSLIKTDSQHAIKLLQQFKEEVQALKPRDAHLAQFNQSVEELIQSIKTTPLSRTTQKPDAFTEAPLTKGHFSTTQPSAKTRAIRFVLGDNYRSEESLALLKDGRKFGAANPQTAARLLKSKDLIQTLEGLGLKDKEMRSGFIAGLIEGARTELSDTSSNRVLRTDVLPQMTTGHAVLISPLMQLNSSSFRDGIIAVASHNQEAPTQLAQRLTLPKGAASATSTLIPHVQKQFLPFLRTLHEIDPGSPERDLAIKQLWNDLKLQMGKSIKHDRVQTLIDFVFSQQNLPLPIKVALYNSAREAGFAVKPQITTHSERMNTPKIIGELQQWTQLDVRVKVTNDVAEQLYSDLNRMQIVIEDRGVSTPISISAQEQKPLADETPLQTTKRLEKLQQERIEALKSFVGNDSDLIKLVSFNICQSFGNALSTALTSNNCLEWSELQVTPPNGSSRVVLSKKDNGNIVAQTSVTANNCSRFAVRSMNEMPEPVFIHPTENAPSPVKVDIRYGMQIEFSRDKEGAKREISNVYATIA